MLKAAHHRHTVVLREICFGGVAVYARGVHEVEGRAPLVFFVDGFGEDYAGGATDGRLCEADDEAADEEHLVEKLKVAIVQLRADGNEFVARLLESGGDVREFGHDAEWGGEHVVSRLVFFLISYSYLAYYIEERYYCRY